MKKAESEISKELAGGAEIISERDEKQKLTCELGDEFVTPPGESVDANENA